MTSGSARRRGDQAGAVGVGELTDKGWGLNAAYAEPRILPQNKRMHPDDPRLDPFWEKCAYLNLPVNIHVADHPSCWQPLGPNQERTPDFQAFNMVGKDVPSYEELIASRDRMVAKHPRTTFIACHLGNQGNDLATLAQTLDPIQTCSWTSRRAITSSGVSRALRRSS